MLVYKYVVPDRIDILENGKIRFTQPGALNDPFESMPSFSQYKLQVTRTIHEMTVRKFGTAMAESTLRERESLVQGALLALPKLFGEHFAFLSLSKQQNNLLMWSHYADVHRGFVIGFDSDSIFFQPGQGKAKDGLREVIYSSHRFIIPENGLTNLADDDLNTANLGMFFTKSLSWEYEQEMRIMALPSSSDQIIKVPGQYDICLFNFPSECMKEIILGYQIDNKLRERIIELVALKYPGTKIYRAMLHDSEFQLSIESY